MFSAVVSALFVGLMWPYAIEQTKTQITDWLNNPDLMRDTAVILSIDVILQMAYCMLAAHIMTTGEIKRRTLVAYKVLRWFPGILIYPVLFSILVAVIFSFPGHSFTGISWTLAVMVLIVIPSGTFLLRWLLPEKELRLELLFLCNALIGMLGVISTVNGQTAVTGQTEIEWSALAGLLLMILIGGILGMVFRVIYYKIKYKNQSF